MGHPRRYSRAHYRLPVAYPAIFSDDTTIGEGQVKNLSVFGCTIECTNAVPEKTTLLVRLILPDQRESLPIESAEVRWVKGRQVGLKFNKLERKADLRLHVFMWDRMLDRLQTIQRENAAKLAS